MLKTSVGRNIGGRLLVLTRGLTATSKNATSSQGTQHSETGSTHLRFLSFASNPAFASTQVGGLDAVGRSINLTHTLAVNTHMYAFSPCWGTCVIRHSACSISALIRNAHTRLSDCFPTTAPPVLSWYLPPVICSICHYEEYQLKGRGTSSASDTYNTRFAKVLGQCEDPFGIITFVFDGVATDGVADEAGNLVLPVTKKHVKEVKELPVLLSAPSKSVLYDACGGKSEGPQ